MKAELNENGLLTVKPETQIEAYALRHWVNAAWVTQNDVERMENGHWRGRMLVVITAAPKQEG